MKWIRVAKHSYKYDVISALENLEYIDWEKSRFNISVGDIVFLYVTKYEKIMFKMICTQDNVAKEDLIDDSAYWINLDYYYDNCERCDLEGTKFIRLEYIGKTDSSKLTCKNLKDLGLIKPNYIFRGALKSENNKDLFKYINDEFIIVDNERTLYSGKILSEIIGADENDNLETVEIIKNPEGEKKLIYTTKYERNPENRRQAIKLHGTKCMVCGFDFENIYGDYGKGFIEVHHVKPLAETDDSGENINPETDLVCVCSNCHRMIHHRKGNILRIEELKAMMRHQALNR